MREERASFWRLTSPILSLAPCLKRTNHSPAVGQDVAWSFLSSLAYREFVS